MPTNQSALGLTKPQLTSAPQPHLGRIWRADRPQDCCQVSGLFFALLWRSLFLHNFKRFVDRAITKTSSPTCFKTLVQSRGGSSGFRSLLSCPAASCRAHSGLPPARTARPLFPLSSNNSLRACSAPPLPTRGCYSSSLTHRPGGIIRTQLPLSQEAGPETPSRPAWLVSHPGGLGPPLLPTSSRSAGTQGPRTPREHRRRRHPWASAPHEPRPGPTPRPGPYESWGQPLRAAERDRWGPPPGAGCLAPHSPSTVFFLKREAMAAVGPETTRSLLSPQWASTSPSGDQEAARPPKPSRLRLPAGEGRDGAGPGRPRRADPAFPSRSGRSLSELGWGGVS